MDSSHGFGSHRRDVFACFRLGVPLAPQLYHWLTGPRAMHSPDHSTKGTPSAARGCPHWPLTAGEYEGSGSLSFPSRGAFHLSLTVLVHYRSHRGLSLGEWSPQLPTPLLVERGTQEPADCFCLPTTGRSPALVSCSNDFMGLDKQCDAGPTTPTSLARAWFGLVPVRSPLLRESRLISCRWLLRCFSSPLACPCLWIQQGLSRHNSG